MQRKTWTPEQDSILRAGRAAGRAWATISWQTGRSRGSCIERAKALGVPEKLPATTPERTGRDSLPAGSEVSWQILTEGTSLAGTPYPRS